MLHRRSPLLALALASVVALGSAFACGRAPSDVPALGDAGAPIDPVLLAFLSRAKSAHHIADQHEEAGELEKAIEPLESLVKGPLPAGAAADAPEVREVTADTLARLADLKSQLGRFEAAEKDLSRGLDLARETTYFRGHLFEVRGLVEERMSRAEKDKGNTQAAEDAKKRALDAFEKSMSIQAEVIEKATRLEGGP
ncbi:MAG: hypothetical protein U0263_23675 [Polyangiaceae bacterium]